MTDHKMNDQSPLKTGIVRAVLTDVQFWVPALVLATGVIILITLH